MKKKYILSSLILVNFLTTIRLCIGIWFIASITKYPTSFEVIILIIAGITDIMDGLIARKFSGASKIGGLYDTFADKLLAVTILIKFYICNLVIMSITITIILQYLTLPCLGFLYLKKYSKPPKTSIYAKVSNFIFIISFLTFYMFENYLLINSLLVGVVVLNLFHISSLFTPLTTKKDGQENILQ